jgi:hypothetical protein
MPSEVIVASYAVLALMLFQIITSFYTILALLRTQITVTGQCLRTVPLRYFFSNLISDLIAEEQWQPLYHTVAQQWYLLLHINGLQQ